jgi:hypothetical protein
MMHTLNALRNIVVYEGSELNQHELAALDAAWVAIDHWRKSSAIAQSNTS